MFYDQIVCSCQSAETLFNGHVEKKVKKGHAET